MSLICRCSQMLSASGKKLNLKSLKKLEWTRSPWWEAWGMEDDGSDGTRQPSRLWHFEIFWVWTTWSGLDAEESPRNWEMRNPLTQRWNDKNLEKGGTVAAFQNPKWRVRRTKKEELWRCFRRRTWCTWFDQHNSKYIREIARWHIHKSKYIRSHLRETTTCTVLALDLQSSARWCWLGSPKLSLQTWIEPVSLLPFVSAATRCYFLLCCDRAERPISVGAHSRVSTQYFGPKKPSN